MSEYTQNHKSIASSSNTVWCAGAVCECRGSDTWVLHARLFDGYARYNLVSYCGSLCSWYWRGGKVEGWCSPCPPCITGPPTVCKGKDSTPCSVRHSQQVKPHSVSHSPIPSLLHQPLTRQNAFSSKFGQIMLGNCNNNDSYYCTQHQVIFHIFGNAIVELIE